MLYAICFATFCATMLGGLGALRLKDKLHLILGFSAGAVIGVAFFDLLPEALALGSKTYEMSTVVTAMALGFLIYLVLDRTIFHHDHEEDVSLRRGRAGASTLSFHSVLDGIGIGLGFQASTSLGIIIAIAVLVHDFSDGINTVNFILKNGGERRVAFRWLLVDAIAPTVGVVITLFFSVSQEHLGLLFALFAGFFFYIGASDLVPESHHAHPTHWTTFMTVAGAALLYAIIHFAG
jgi:zinc transporter ZupT